MNDVRLADVRRAARRSGMSDIVLGPDAWREVAAIARSRGDARVLIVVDRTIVLRDGAPLKEAVAALLAAWAFASARLMRKRTTVSDVLAFSGRWTEEFLQHIFDVFETLTKPHAGASPRPSVRQRSQP